MRRKLREAFKFKIATVLKFSFKIFFTGKAVNYLVSVPSFRKCHDACVSDKRCCHYSYHRSQRGHPDHENCFLYSSGACDINSLILRDYHSHWRTGWRALCQKQQRNQKSFNSFIGSEFVG